ncbi:hypothetical protein R3P38DRAFT_2934899 [Favolaschia claudopus]|uniref:Uncharacterized protein n=1 Tax=Favolaschia claudopus TaxID=2862362 RepID=A0AAW0BR72_9AGAR
MPSDTESPPNPPPAYNNVVATATNTPAHRTVSTFMNMALTNDTTDDSDSDSESNVPDLVSDDDTPNGHGGHGSQSTPGPINAMTRNMQALTIASRPLVGRGITPADAFYRFPNRLVHRALQDAIESNAHVGRVRTNIRRLHRGGQYYRATAHARAVHDQLVRDLITHLQRAEHVLQGFLDDHHRYYPRHR